MVAISHRINNFRNKLFGFFFYLHFCASARVFGVRSEFFVCLWLGRRYAKEKVSNLLIDWLVSHWLNAFTKCLWMKTLAKVDLVVGHWHSKELKATHIIPLLQPQMTSHWNIHRFFLQIARPYANWMDSNWQPFKPWMRGHTKLATIQKHLQTLTHNKELTTVNQI